MKGRSESEDLPEDEPRGRMRQPQRHRKPRKECLRGLRQWQADISTHIQPCGRMAPVSAPPAGDEAEGFLSSGRFYLKAYHNGSSAASPKGCGLGH